MTSPHELHLPRGLWLESSAHETRARALLHPGARGDDVVLGDADADSSVVESSSVAVAGLTPWRSVGKALEKHVHALGLPHTLVLAGEEGCGKSTALATLAENLRAMDAEEEREERARAEAEAAGDVSPRARKKSEQLPQRRAPYVVHHSFGDASFGNDVAHFLERACAQLRARFNIHEPLPTDPGDLPAAFASFLEHAATFRKILVIVDGLECATVAPLASFAAASTAGLDRRERRVVDEVLKERRSPRERGRMGTSHDDDDDDVDDEESAERERATAAARSRANPPSSSNFAATVAWLPHSPPLAVRFILAARDAKVPAEDGVARAVVARCPAAAAILHHPSLDSESDVAACMSNAPLPDGLDGEDIRYRACHPEVARLVLERFNAAGGGGTPRDDDGDENAARDASERTPRPRVTPLYARLLAPMTAELCASAAPSIETSVDNEIELVPLAVKSAIARAPRTARGLANATLARLEARFGEDIVRITTVVLALARFGLTRDELKAAVTRRIKSDRSLVRAAPAVSNATDGRAALSSRAAIEMGAAGTIGGRRVERMGKYASRVGGSPVASRLLLEASRGRVLSRVETGEFDALVRELRAWLAPCTSASAWEREREVFEGDKTGAERVAEAAAAAATGRGEEGDNMHAVDAPKEPKEEEEEEEENGGLLAGFDEEAEMRAMRKRLLGGGGGDDDDDDSPTSPPPDANGTSSSAASVANADALRRRREEYAAANGFAGDEVPFAYRDAEVRAAVLARYAPVDAVGGDGDSLRRGYHADLCAHFLDDAPPDGYGSVGAVAATARRVRSRRSLRAGLWHASAAGQTHVVAKVLGRRGVVAGLSAPGARSDVAAAALGPDGVLPASLWSAWEEHLASWMEEDIRGVPGGGRMMRDATTASASGSDASDDDDVAATTTTQPPSGEAAGAALAIGALLAWLREPSLAAALIHEALVGTYDGRDDPGWSWGRAASCALTLARAANEAAAGDVATAEKLTRDALAAASATDVNERSFSGVVDYGYFFPNVWRDAIFASGAGAGVAVRSPKALVAEARELLADVVSSRLEAAAAAASELRGAEDDDDDDDDRADVARSEILALHALEVEACEAACAASATPAVADVLRAALSDAPSVAPPAVTRQTIFMASETADGAAKRRGHVEDVVKLLRALRRHSDAAARLGHRAQSKTSAARVMRALETILGADHPEHGNAALDAVETASASCNTRSDYAAARTNASSAYAFAVAFYGPQSLPAARAAWCHAECLRRGGDFGDARKQYALALAATMSVLGARHKGAGAMLSAVGELSCADGRLDEADALCREALSIAEEELVGAERAEAAAVAAAADVVHAANTGKGAGAAPTPPEIVEAALHAAGDAESRRVDAEADVYARAASLATIARLAGRIPEAEALTRRALTAGEKVLGPGRTELSPTLASLGRIAMIRRRPEEAEACYRHAISVDETAAAKARAETNANENATTTTTTTTTTKKKKKSPAAASFRHPRSASYLFAIATVHRRASRDAEAEVAYLAALAALESVPVSYEHLDIKVNPGEILHAIAAMYANGGRLSEAALRYERAIALGAERMRAAESRNDLDQWREASVAVSARLCHLGDVFARQGRDGNAAACYLRATTFSENNLGREHEHSVSCRVRLTAAGGVPACASGVGHAAGVMLDAVIAGEFPRMSTPFKTAWGPLGGGGTTSSATSKRPPAAANANANANATLEAVTPAAHHGRERASKYARAPPSPYPARDAGERPGSATSRGAGRPGSAAIGRRPGTARARRPPSAASNASTASEAADLRDAASSRSRSRPSSAAEAFRWWTSTTPATFGDRAPPPPPSVVDALAAYRQREGARAAWHEYWTHPAHDANGAFREVAAVVEALDVDGALASVIDDVAERYDADADEPADAVSAAIVAEAAVEETETSKKKKKTKTKTRRGKRRDRAPLGDEDILDTTADEDVVRALEDRVRSSVDVGAGGGGVSASLANDDDDDDDDDELPTPPKHDPSAAAAAASKEKFVGNDLTEEDELLEYYRQKLQTRLLVKEEEMARRNAAREAEETRATKMYESYFKPRRKMTATEKLRDRLRRREERENETLAASRPKKALTRELFDDHDETGTDGDVTEDDDPFARLGLPTREDARDSPRFSDAATEETTSEVSYWSPGEIEVAASYHGDLGASLRLAAEEREDVLRELRELEEESRSRAASRATSARPTPEKPNKPAANPGVSVSERPSVSVAAAAKAAAAARTPPTIPRLNFDLPSVAADVEAEEALEKEIRDLEREVRELKLAEDVAAARRRATIDDDAASTALTSLAGHSYTEEGGASPSAIVEAKIAKLREHRAERAEKARADRARAYFYEQKTQTHVEREMMARRNAAAAAAAEPPVSTAALASSPKARPAAAAAASASTSSDEDEATDEDDGMSDAVRGALDETIDDVDLAAPPAFSAEPNPPLNGRGRRRESRYDANDRAASSYSHSHSHSYSVGGSRETRTHGAGANARDHEAFKAVERGKPPGTPPGWLRYSRERPMEYLRGGGDRREPLAPARGYDNDRASYERLMREETGGRYGFSSLRASGAGGRTKASTRLMEDLEDARRSRASASMRKFSSQSRPGTSGGGEGFVSRSIPGMSGPGGERRDEEDEWMWRMRKKVEALAAKRNAAR